MKNVFFSIAVLSSILTAGSVQAAEVTCKVENPCAWLADEGYGQGALGYCVTQITGDAANFYVHVASEQNADLPPIELVTEVYTATEVVARSTDGTINLNGVIQSAGSFSIGNFGFFVFCEKL